MSDIKELALVCGLLAVYAVTWMPLLLGIN